MSSLKTLFLAKYLVTTCTCHANSMNVVLGKIPAVVANTLSKLAFYKCFTSTTSLNNIVRIGTQL